ncbi:mitochondrial ribosomal component of the small subunit [Candida orthopsilosis Co 90-125]|uniref:Small ribosomal subunit protein uS4m n=1 Tax=Candida orthopsilosis (strain 90-125) TaxID=1136231 RepID=H8X4Y0_CANO9|nr:mitochondrial ribosomal component of the small subunit [Candida orthopsilosis Co 90-125]CCG23073.1 mitochondrial ribosomal component of the small subunit [Candida orthopsilosis Co 90-125]
MPRKLDNVSRMVRGHIGMSMNRLNLFNLQRKVPLNYVGKTLYQQKWAAKSETRAYHGEHLKEKRFKKVLFEPELKTYSQLDSSLKSQEIAPTPITLQTYATLEKRLEFALFRSMFASSVRQARQFIMGGYVKVNGVVIKHPSFPLKSGDVFSVDPERVLYALGKTKPSLSKAIDTDNKQIRYWNHYVKVAKKNPQKVWEMQQNKPESLNSIANIEARKRLQDKQHNGESLMKAQQQNVSRKSILSDIIKLGNAASANIGLNTFEKYGEKLARGKCLQVYESLASQKSNLLDDHSPKSLDIYFSKDTERTPEEKTSLRHVNNLLRELEKSEWERIRLEFENLGTGATFYDPSYAEKLNFIKSLNKEEILEDETKAKVLLPWQRHLFGRQDASKPYFTPWTPRPFLGAFAILPSHIEISFDTCHAVYLRDPVARPGHSEVISPFPEHVHERAYMYYIKKGMS